MRTRALLASAVIAAAVAGGGAYAALAGSGGKPGRPQITARPANPTRGTSASFAFSSKRDAAFLCSLDDSAATPCGTGLSGSASYAGPLADGEHRFGVAAASGGAIGRPRTWTWTVDTVPPPAPDLVETFPDAATKATARFRYDVAERRVTFECSLDASSRDPCKHAATYRHLVPGTHSFCVRALDRAGNAGPDTCHSWLVTTASLDLAIAGGPLRGALLYPGGQALPLDLVFTNPNDVAITVSEVSVSVIATSTPACLVDSFAVVPLRATPIVPAGETRSLQELGVPESKWPQLRMIDRGNQDACQGASVTLAYSGTATG
jgi:hypothetical protein